MWLLPATCPPQAAQSVGPMIPKLMAWLVPVTSHQQTLQAPRGVTEQARRRLRLLHVCPTRHPMEQKSAGWKMCFKRQPHKQRRPWTGSCLMDRAPPLQEWGLPAEKACHRLCSHVTETGPLLTPHGTLWAPAGTPQTKRMFPPLPLLQWIPHVAKHKLPRGQFARVRAKPVGDSRIRR